MCTISIFICRTSHSLSLFIFLNTRSLTFVKLGYNKLTQQQQKKDNNLIQFYCLNIKCKDLKIYFHTPILFNQRESYSNILNRYTNYFNMNRARNLANIPQKKLIL